MIEIRINSEDRNIRPPQANNCHGHYTSIAAGGNGHNYGDGCGCDGINPESSIEFITPILLITAIFIIIKNKLKTSH